MQAGVQRLNRGGTGRAGRPGAGGRRGRCGPSDQQPHCHDRAISLLLPAGSGASPPPHHHKHTCAHTHTSLPLLTPTHTLPTLLLEPVTAGSAAMKAPPTTHGTAMWNRHSSVYCREREQSKRRHAAAVDDEEARQRHDNADGDATPLQEEGHMGAERGAARYRHRRCPARQARSGSSGKRSVMYCCTSRSPARPTCEWKALSRWKAAAAAKGTALRRVTSTVDVVCVCGGWGVGDMGGEEQRKVKQARPAQERQGTAGRANARRANWAAVPRPPPPPARPNAGPSFAPSPSPGSAWSVL